LAWPTGKSKPKTGGRKKGVPNKFTASLKQAILDAAQIAGGGGQEGLRDYLVRQAHENPGPFMGLLGRVLPHQLAAGDEEGGGGITVVIQKFTDVETGLVTANPNAAIDAGYKRLSGPTDNK
jgi:hypothetical protein